MQLCTLEKTPLFHDELFAVKYNIKYKKRKILFYYAYICVVIIYVYMLLKMTKSQEFWPWLVWLSGLGMVSRIQRSPVGFLVREHAWVACVPGPWLGCARGNWSMFLLHTDVAFPLFFPPFLLFKTNK